MQEIARSLFDPTSIWFFVFQSVVWFGVCIVATVSVATKSTYDTSYHSFKSHMGMFLLFITLTTALIYIMFAQPTSANTV
ncbi:MAG: hypothetical protein UX04_C0003G0074 [Microgenomates group bacterium GW2011_GWF2_45_18]|nr:MAG: hypothetical protein UW18_C0002G0074 [Microgenomates group bacterium GW2011_GWF1_44_10]KKU01802.1 MAG: hypothetical protein UX04_C0003G0074 [Microgenomates group bacterium GW2011_GWF2_45_18]OGJ41277.1 MAG: hypothetical protein A2378_04275 [Candidatus Pacebacteria bacterium RIFOXYB1_FULL_44_10]HAU98894.1 hypothetical protein [Candidatus Paceibacterota bacterium]HAX01149.1 hypothetical protein [Candidatus Paceibacterota bacterium]